MEALEACNQREKCAESQDSHNFSAKTMWFVTLCVNQIEPMIVPECSCQSAGSFLSLDIGTGRNDGGSDTSALIDRYCRGPWYDKIEKQDEGTHCQSRSVTPENSEKLKLANFVRSSQLGNRCQYSNVN
jgi:hypothetical protein